MKTLVLGGSRGIGAAVVRFLRKNNEEVFFTYHQNKNGAEVIEKETGAKKIQYDMTSSDSIQRLIHAMRAEKFDGLVNCAAEPFARKFMLKTDVNDFLRTIDNGIRGVFLISQAFAAHLKEIRSGGAIVHVLSSTVLGLPPSQWGGYVALKHLLLGLSRSQAVEFIPYRIRVNSVSPGMTRTDFISDLPEKFIELYKQKVPLGRLAMPEEVASAICFLLSPAASYIHGVNIPVTGGLTC